MNSLLFIHKSYIYPNHHYPALFPQVHDSELLDFPTIRLTGIPLFQKTFALKTSPTIEVHGPWQNFC